MLGGSIDLAGSEKHGLGEELGARDEGLVEILAGEDCWVVSADLIEQFGGEANGTTVRSFCLREIGAVAAVFVLPTRFDVDVPLSPLGVFSDDVAV